MIAEDVNSDASSASKQKSKSEEKDTDTSEDTKYKTKKENITLSGLSAGPTHTPSEPKERNENAKRDKLPDTKPFENAPYISYDEFNLQDGDFIRYVKEDGIVYQGKILRGEPVEHEFNYYYGQENDYVVKLNFKNGKHVAGRSVQQADKITIMKARQQTSFGRNIETVSPEEIIAVSPDYEYDWYKFEENWNTQEDIFVVETD